MSTKKERKETALKILGGIGTGLAILTFFGIAVFIGMIDDGSIQVGDIVRCGDLVSHQYDGEVVYRENKFLVVSGTDESQEYGDSENCPVEKDKYGNCTRVDVHTGQRVFKDDCFRPNNYHDLIQREKGFNSHK